jgi:MFS family permease
MISSSTARSRRSSASNSSRRSSETAQFLLALASFGVGFGVRPIGAMLFGYLGDRLGRKYTFLVTITLMGLATAAVGLVPGYAAIGIAAPACSSS